MLSQHEYELVKTAACEIAGEIRERVPRVSNGDVGCLVWIVLIGMLLVVASLWRIEDRLERAGIGVEPKAEAAGKP